MVSGTKPNILFIVWDACRYDYALEHAPTLRKLGEEGVWFENAIAPATWSLPSHTSMFTGKYPHEHGVTQPSQSKIPTTLSKEIGSEGYSTYCVSGNGFASNQWGFGEGFDYLRFTQGPEPYSDGLEMYDFLREKTERENNKRVSVLNDALYECATHDHKFKSSVNLLSVIINHPSREQLPVLQKIPHDVFRDGPQYSYNGEKNSKIIKKIFKKEGRSENPFFLFTNYMETHRPYVPNSKLQKKHLGESLTRKEIFRLNEEIADPWEYISRVEGDGVDHSDIQKLRSLYAGEVETVDQHLNSVLEHLENNGLLKDTVVVVTADHGEMLGEKDSFGRHRMGHEAAMSDHLSRVPLVISHPSLGDNKIRENVSLKEIYDFLLEAATVGEIDLNQLFSRDTAFCEYPALGDDSMYEEYPDVKNQIIKQRVSQDTISGYSGQWYVVIDSDGVEIAKSNGEEQPVKNAPRELTDQIRSNLNVLSELGKQDINRETAGRLKDLGYL